MQFFGPYGIPGDLDSGSLDATEFAYLQIDWDKNIVEEIKTQYNYPITYNSALPFEKFSMDYAGEYHFKIKFYMTHAAIVYISPGVTFWDGYYDMTRLGAPDIEVVITVNGITVGTFTQTDYGTDGSAVDPAYSSFEYEGTHVIPAKGLVVITGVIVTGFPSFPCWLEMTAPEAGS